MFYAMFQHEDRYTDRKKRPTTASTRTFINFVSAKQRQISSSAASKARRRGNELLQMIEMDTTGYEIFDMPPIKEYDMYIRSYGGLNSQQVN